MELSRRTGPPQLAWRAEEGRRINLGFSLLIDFVNLGLFPLKLGLLEASFEAIELTIAMIAGAAVYEEGAKRSRATE